MLISPLLLQIEAHYGMSHAEGGALFLVISAGFSVSILLSGFVAEKLHHRSTVLLSVLGVAAALTIMGLAPPKPLFYVALLLLGAGTGLYGPSGIAMLTGVSNARHWGKALALHEVGPILGFFAAPVLAQVAIAHGSWQLLFLAVALGSGALALLFSRFAEGGRFPGAAPNPRNLMAIWSIGRFWIIALFFVLAVGLEIGVYAMLPTFLIEERGLSPALTNTIVGISRLSALVLVFSSGWLADRLGSTVLIGAVALLSGAATVAIGFATGVPLIVAVLLQPMLVAAFFPAGLIELSHLSPAENRNLTIATVVPLANLFGAGLVPSGMGILAEHGLFWAGFVAVGGLMLGAAALVPLLRTSSPRA
jgi:NNP family nitrate/nitrite transporter-like MFS transporter